jgi:drug/metabolite transporter (DMT)-like permease
MNWVLITVLAITSRATYSIGTRVLSKDVEVSPITHSLLLTAAAGLLSLLISPFVGGISFEGLGAYAIPAGIMVTSQAVGNVIYFRGQKNLGAGTTQIAFSSILIWGAILSVFFLGSTFSLTQVIGIAVMLIAILTVQYAKGEIELDSSFMYIVASAVLFAIFQVASADLSKTISTGAYLVMAYLGPTVIIGGLYFNKIKRDFKHIVHQLKNTFSKTLFASGTSMLYFVFSYLAYRQAPDRGVVVVLLTSQVVFSVLFGIFFLGERKNVARKLLAGLLAFVAGVLIKS